MADVVVVGAGATGLPAAVEAVEHGASVIVVDQNYDVGGYAIISGGHISLGGGTTLQNQLGVVDSPDLYFSDLTANTDEYMFNDRALVRALVDNSASTYDWLVAHGVVFLPAWYAYTSETGAGWGLSAPRGHLVSWNEQGTARSPGLAYALTPKGTSSGAGWIRPLENVARGEGVQFLLNYKMTGIIRAPLSGAYQGRVLGITANYTPTILPGTTTPLQSYLSEGNISNTTPTLNIGATKAVIVGSGGIRGAVQLRTVFDPRLTEQCQAGGEPQAFHTGEGITEAQKIGAQLAGADVQSLELGPWLIKMGSIGCQYSITGAFLPGNPTYPLIRASGLAVTNWQDCITVNMSGLRFYNELDSTYSFIDAALAINSASAAPDYSTGPVWAIFDADAVTREKWTVTPPYVDTAGGYFFSADTLTDLATALSNNSYQVAPMSGTTLQATVTRYNSFVDSGVDSDFAKPKPLYKIQTPPFYAAWATPVTFDTRGGLRINANSQVVDVNGNVIPGLYAGGEAAGGLSYLGTGKGIIQGRIAAMAATS